MSELRKLIYNSLVYIVEPSIKGKDLDKIVEGIVKGIRELMSKKKDEKDYQKWGKGFGDDGCQEIDVIKYKEREKGYNQAIDDFHKEGR